MPAPAQSDPVLRRFRAALHELYGDRIERVVLFGSRARGEAGSDSDYDVAVFLRDLANRRSEARRLVDLSSDLIRETGEVIHAIPFRAGAYAERTPLMHEIRLDGIDLPNGAPAPRGELSKPARPLVESWEGERGMAGMSPEAGLYLAKGRRSLREARATLDIGLAEQAGRLAYVAAFHAAQALIFERSGRAVKTHRGVRARFEQLAAAELGLDDDLRRFLARGYELKTIADYQTGPDAVISSVDAAAAIATAERFVERIGDRLGEGRPE